MPARKVNKKLDGFRQDSVKRAFIYARVSSKEQEKEGYSIPAQIRMLQDYANAKDFLFRSAKLRSTVLILCCFV